MSADHRPATVEALAALVRARAGAPASASGARRGLRIAGAATWMDAGHPVREAEHLSLGAFRGIEAYTPADLTISVGAATTLAELDAATAAHGQWCPLLPWGDDHGTVGATIATATTGPFAERLGRPRQLVLGVECVDGTGRIVRAGGRVVKNVAGFDLTRAVTGAWGTLAVITRLHLRLRARPAVDVTLAVACPATEAATSRLAAFTRGPLAPLGVVAVEAADAAAIGAPGATHLVRLGGNAALVREARTAVGSLGAVTELEAAAWSTIRARLAPAPRLTGWRWDALASRLRDRFDPARILNPGLLGDPT
ncbi:MAG: FAD-binding protein [Gemmatimonadaceae bacterium]|nr:FAD-binding protein [Gemmatimonadaceae bacterium]